LERYGQLAKNIVGRALCGLGSVRVEHEIPVVDAQSGDASRRSLRSASS
jgi:hypothetical protein